MQVGPLFNPSGHTFFVYLSVDGIRLLMSPARGLVSRTNNTGGIT